MPRVYEHPSQDKALEAIREFSERVGLPPTVRELGSLLGLSRTRAHQLVNALAKAGRLQRMPGRARAVRVAPVAPGPDTNYREA